MATTDPQIGPHGNENSDDAFVAAAIPTPLVKVDDGSIIHDGVATTTVPLLNGLVATSSLDSPAGLTSSFDTDYHEAPVPIAICGMAMRLPGGISNSDELWDFLINKKDARSEVPAERYNADAFHGEGHHGYFLKDLDLHGFDASHFRVSRFEVERMDPQQRLMLELARECFESAGEVDWRGKLVGCYVGTWGDDWKEFQTRDKQEAGMATVNGHSDFMIPNKISFEYDLKGPSLAVKTACSSSLIALHHAFRDLQNGEATSAIVGGVNMLLSPMTTTAMYKGGLLSKNDSSRTFDADADGYTRAEAANMVYIKRLDDAVRDGNPIRAVIRAASSNHNGAGDGESSMAFPSSDGQEALIRSCYRSAGLEDFGKTAHFECHGTGTPAGDPVETTAIANVWGDYGGISIGASKPNLGHSEGASGLTSLIKSVLALEHKTILPNIKFDKPHERIPFERGGLRVPTEPLPLPEDRHERISINAFGLGGSNAHVILDSADSFNLGPKQRLPQLGPISRSRPRLLVSSGTHQETTKASGKRINEFIQKQSDILEDVEFTLARRREHLAYRTFAIADGTLPLEFSAPAKVPTETPDYTFVFTGQGAQWPAMGAKLLEDFPSVSRTLSLMDEALASLGPELAPEWKFAEELSKTSENSNIAKAEFSQPLCTAVQIVVVDLITSWGIQPSSVVGHSSGEMAAAYASGALTLQEAIICSYLRGSVTKKVSRAGGMAAIGLGREAVQKYLIEGVLIACENSPSSVTLSGDSEKIDEVIQFIKSDDPELMVRRLRVDKGYHSHHMQEVGPSYEELLAPHLSSKAPFVPFYSSVTNKIIGEAGNLDASYWRANMESPVLFNTALTRLLQDNNSSRPTVLVEFGPHSALAGPIRQILKASGTSRVTYIPTLLRNEDDTGALLRTAGQLYLQGSTSSFEFLFPHGQVISNLPTYSWHREGKFWAESRLVREWKSYPFPHHELLGSPVFECSRLEPVWRNMLMAEAIPWVRDHVIDRDVVLPGAAYVVIACEAIRQLSNDTAEDYSLRNITLSSAMILPETSALEVITSLKPVHLTRNLDSDWYEFTVSSFNGSGWTKHCSGQVRAGTDNVKPQSRNISDYPRRVNSPQWYQSAKSFGMHFGPLFQSLKPQSTTAHPTKNVAVAHVSDVIPGTRRSKNPSCLHAITIDCALQLFPQSAFNGLSRYFNVLRVPTFLGEVYIRRPTVTGDVTLEVSGEHTNKGDILGQCLGVDEKGEVVIQIKNGRLSPMGEENTNNLKDSFRIHWQPDITFQQLSKLITSNRTLDIREPYRPLQKLLLLCCIETEKKLENTTITDVHHLRKFQKWIREHVDRAEKEGYLLVDDSAALLALSSVERRELIEKLADELQSSPLDSMAAAIKRVFDNAEDIFSGRSDGIEVLRQDDLLTRVYNLSQNCDYTQFARLLSHRTPHLRVLEVGAGTGATSELMLKGMTSPYGDRMYGQYVFTDISAGFFTAAKERFSNRSNIHFQVLDVSRDPAEQGFELGSFDLVIAANVLHATDSLSRSLSNVRKLLKPNGYIMLQELHSAMKVSNYVMGPLSGWWMGEEDGRPDEPYVSPEVWKEELTKAGFAGSEAAVILDDEEPWQSNAVIIASPNVEKVTSCSVSLLSSNPEGPVAKAFVEALESRGLSTTLLSLGEEPKLNMISILDLEGKPYLEDISEADFQKLKSFFLKSYGGRCLWLTKACQIKCKEPQYAASIGFTRSLNNELPLRLATLELDEFESAAAKDAIAQVYQGLHSTTGDYMGVDPDREFAWSEGHVCTPRFHWISVQDELAAKDHEQKRSNAYKTLDVAKKGSLKTMRWVDKTLADPEEGQVVVDMRAVGINFKDLLEAMGIVEGHMGLEGSGIIKSVGAGVSDLQVGDRVAILGKYMYSTSMTVRAAECFKIPDDVSFEEAATLPISYFTATHSLLNLARLEAGQSILIQSACGATGLAAIQISRMIGAEIYATVGSDEKVQHLMENFGIPRNHIFHSRNSSFLPDLLRETDGRGVDVVLNSLSGDLLHASWNCVAEFGCMVELGKRDFVGHGKLALDIFEENRSFFGLDLFQIYNKRPQLMRQIFNKAVGFIRSGAVKPINPITVFEAAEVESAFREMQKGKHIGKLVVRIPNDPAELKTASQRQGLTFRPEVSYFLAGGLGGLGRSVSSWMAERGAKNLVYLSRSGGTKPEDQALVEELAAAGCTTQIFQGSVGNLADVENAVNNARLPIAGVLQMVLVLKDRMFENTTYEDWTDVVDPKIPGTWNIHKALQGHNLDFFVLFSSTTGVMGFKAQANYASGGAFQDAFVQARHSQGLPASVLDVGPVDDIGYLFERPHIQAKLRAGHIYFIREQGVLDGFELAIKKSLPEEDTNDPLSTTGYVSSSQISLGFRSTTPLNSPNNRVAWKRDPRCSLYRNIEDNSDAAASISGSGSGADEKFKSFLSTVETNPSSVSEEENVLELAQFIGTTLCGFMMKSADELDINAGVTALGIDSLVATELKNWVRQRLALDISVLEIMASPSIIALGRLVAERLLIKWGIEVTVPVVTEVVVVC